MSSKRYTLFIFVRGFVQRLEMRKLQKLLEQPHQDTGRVCSYIAGRHWNKASLYFSHPTSMFGPMCQS